MWLTPLLSAAACSGGATPPAGQIAASPVALGRAHSGDRQRAAHDDLFLRARLLQPIESDLDVRIRFDRALDKRIELGVAEGAPPGTCVDNRRGRTLEEAIGEAPFAAAGAKAGAASKASGTVSCGA